MRGETVTLDSTSVDNVLVEPMSPIERNVPDAPTGVVARYTLRLPVGLALSAQPKTATVRGSIYDVLTWVDHMGADSVFADWTNPWDMTAIVGERLPDLDTSITVYSLSTSIDSLGDGTVTETSVYSGTAQARQSGGTEAVGEAIASDANEVWYFVAPWQSGFESLRPQSTVIEANSVRYDVTLIENVDNAFRYASFRAVRHG